MVNPNAWFEVIPENVEISDRQIEYAVSLGTDVYNMEFCIKNLTEENVIILRIEVYRTP